MRCKGLSSLGLVVFLLSGCGAAPQEAFGRADADSIRNTVQSFVSAYNEKNADQVASLFSGSGALMPPNSSQIRGTDSIKSFYEVRFTQGVSGLEIEPDDVGGDGTLAFASGHYVLQLEPENGPQSRDRGKFLWILRNYAGTWRFDYQMWSSDLPPPPPPAPADEDDES